MADHTEDNDPFEEDIVFDQAGLLGGKMPRSRQQSTVGFLPTFMLFIRTVFLCIAFIGLGLCASVSGSPLIRLEVGMGVGVDTAFHIFTARSVGMLLGGMLGSLLFDIYNRQFLMFVSLVWVAVSVTVLPFTVPTALWWTFTTTAALGVGLGFLFTGGNVLCLDLWGRQGGASLQSLHFSFAVGAFIAPLVIHPFFVGMHPAEIHNLTVSPNEFTVQAPEVVRYVREAKDWDSSESSNFSSLTAEEIKELTFPTRHPSFEPYVNVSSDTIISLSNKNQSEISLYNKNQSEISLPDKNQSEIVSPVSILPPSNTSNAANTTEKPSEVKKPSYTNGNNLKPDFESRWQKLPKKNMPDKIEITSVQPLIGTDDVSLSTAITFASKATVTDGISEISISTDPPIIKSESMINDHISLPTNKTLLSEEVKPPTQMPAPSPDIQKHTPSTSEPPKLDATTSTSTFIPVSSTAASVSTTLFVTTLSSTTTTAKPPQTVTSPSLIVTPIPKLIVSDPQDELLGTEKKHFSSYTESYKIQATINTDPDNMGLNDEPDGSFHNVYVDDGPVDDNVSIPEPEVLDLKEPVKDETSLVVEDTGVSTKSPLGQSIIHILKPGTYSNGSDENNQFLDNMAQHFKEYGVTKVHLAYICIGIFIILNALISVVILCHNPREPRSKQEDGNTDEYHKGRMVLFVVIFSVFMFMAESLQGAVHHLLASSTTNTGLDVIKESGLDGQALFWGLVCLVRFLCIMLSGCLRLKPGKLLTIAIIFSVIGSIFMTIGSFGKEDFLWGGIVFMALGLAPILPTSLLWMAQYMRVTHRMCALMVILASFGNSLTHLALTHVIGSSHLYAYILIFISGNSLFFLFLSMCVLYTAQRSKTLGVPIGYQLASQHEEEDSIELTPSGSAVFTPSDPRVRENGEAGQSLLID
ncbi:uncharacterized protein [Palaemon carinicauda]|uniref:uncharacterized protein n=1 Tax=Palaemon carinicauda TaxID=392227 RepID=UPI0035B5D009